MKKKVLFIIESLNCGGAEKSLVSLLPLLDRNKYDIYLWVMYPGGIFEKLVPNDIKKVHYDIYENETIWDCIHLTFCRALYSIRFRLNNIFGIKKHGAELFWECVNKCFKKQDVYFDYAIAYQQGIPTYLLRDNINAQKKLAWVNADIFSVGYNPLLNYQFYKAIDIIVSVSDILKGKLVKKWFDLKDRMYTIYDIINPDIVCSLSIKDIKPYLIDKSKLTLLTVGRLVEPKGYDLLIDAAVELCTRKIKFIWYIIGEGPKRNSLEKEIKKHNLENNVILLGLKDNPYPYMKVCDIYVQTSKYEGFGMSVAEAKILEKPIISTNYSVIYNIIENKKNGLIVEMNGISIANGIQYLLEYEEEKNILISNLQKEKNTTYKTEILKIERILDEN